MPFSPDDLERAERHVSEAETHILSQEQIISKLLLAGESTELAESVLRTFEESLIVKRQERDMISAHLAGTVVK